MSFLYSDINHFNPSEKPLVTDAEAISQSLELIFSSISPQRFFRGEFPGESLDSALYDEVSEIGAISVFRIATQLVDNWEPRVRLDKSQSTVEADGENSRYKITLVYSIIGMTGQQFSQVGFIDQKQLS